MQSASIYPRSGDIAINILASDSHVQLGVYFVSVVHDPNADSASAFPELQLNLQGILWRRSIKYGRKIIFNELDHSIWSLLHLEPSRNLECPNARDGLFGNLDDLLMCNGESPHSQ